MNIGSWRWQELLIVGIFIVIVLGMIIAGIKYLKIKVRIPGVVDADGKPVPPHSKCPHVKDIMSVIARTTELIESRSSCQIELIARQMKYFEELLVELTGKMLKVFISGLADKLGVHDGVIDHPDYRQMVLITATLKIMLGDYIRVSMRQNHLAEFAGIEWTNYKNMKKKAVVQSITGMLNDYWRGTSLTREELYRINIKSTLISDAETGVEQLYEFAREETVKVESAQMQRKEEYEDFLRRKILGEDV